MSDELSDDKRNGCSSNDATTTCCQPSDEKVSSCCNPKGGSWVKGKALLATLIIMAAIGVGAMSFLRGNAAQGVASTPASSSPTPCDAAACTNPSVPGTAPQAEAANPGAGPAQSPCCPVSKPGKAVQ